MIMHGRSLGTIDARIPATCGGGDARTVHAGFPPTGQTSRAPSAKCREVFGEPHEGQVAAYKESFEADCGTLRRGEGGRVENNVPGVLL